MSEIKGLKELIKKLNRSPQIIEKVNQNIVKKSLLIIHTNAIKLLKSNDDGAAQIRYNPKRVVNVSKEGEPPNSDTGELIKSVLFEYDSSNVTGFVGTNKKYGKHLEFGTKKMRARPWLSVAYFNALEKIEKLIEKEYNKGFQEALGVKNIVKSIKKLGKK